MLCMVKCHKEDRKLVNPNEKQNMFNNNVKDYVCIYVYSYR